MSAISTISRVPPQLPLHRFTPELLQRLIDAKILAADRTQPPLRFTVEQYRRMITLGIVPEDTPVELLDGWIVTKMARNPPHDSALCSTHMALFRRLPAEWLCRCLSGMTTDTSQPEPDLAVVQGPPPRYDRHHPTAQETALVIEICHPSLKRDRDFKGPLYAQGGIPIYWIVNIPDDRIEVYTEPTTEAGYQHRRDYQSTESVPLIVAGTATALIPVQAMLPGLRPNPLC